MENNNFEQYDDNNIEHVDNAPDYGQINSKLAWSLENSIEYIQFINASTIESIKYISKLRTYISKRTWCAYLLTLFLFFCQVIIEIFEYL